jgi:hypothetical protein
VVLIENFHQIFVDGPGVVPQRPAEHVKGFDVKKRMANEMAVQISGAVIQPDPFYPTGADGPLL